VKGVRFFAITAEERIVAALGQLDPTNPFNTSAFFASRRRLGAAWVLGLTHDEAQIECGCGAFLTTGTLNRALTIPSLPAVAAESAFWGGLCEFCRDHGVTTLELGTFASRADTKIPRLPGERTRRARCEFVLELGGDWSAHLSSNHKRNLKRARAGRLLLRRTRSADAATAHGELMRQSMDRRRARGEHVGQSGPSPEQEVLLESGAGELFQAHGDGTVLSSVLVLLAPKGGYYHSAGTSPKGMDVGASHFLIHSIADALRAEGAVSFNLGGADELSSLGRFKEGFGTVRVPLAAVNCSLGPAWRRLPSRGVSFVRGWTGRPGSGN
jgi:hypothetical protein